MSNEQTPTLLGGQTHIDIRAIERELTELWKSAAERTDGGQRGAVTRTCVLNLVAVARAGQTSQEVTETVDRLTGMYPNRAIVVSVAPGGPAAEAQRPVLDAWVQAHCQIPVPGRPQVCCEQITIEARGEGVARVPGAVLPLLVPDLPVLLWYPRGEPFDDPLFSRLGALAERVVVDTVTFDSPEDGLRRLAGLTGAQPPIEDMAWGRLMPWREMIAQCFDPPAAAPHLAEITEIVVEYFRDAAAARAQALLLVGWLASRLGMRRAERPAPPSSQQGGASTLISLERGGEEVRVELRPVAWHDDLPGRLAGVSITCRRASLSVARADIPNSVVARSAIEGRPPIQRGVRLQRLDAADLLAMGMRLPGRDTVYEEALRYAAALI